MNIEKRWLDDPKKRSAVFNWMMIGKKQLLKNGKFTMSKTQRETEILFERASNTINAFIVEMAIKNKNFVTTREEAYEAYKNYCEVFDLDVENDKKFTVKMREEKGVTKCKTKNKRA